MTYEEVVTNFADEAKSAADLAKRKTEEAEEVKKQAEEEVNEARRNAEKQVAESEKAVRKSIGMAKAAAEKALENIDRLVEAVNEASDDLKDAVAKAGECARAANDAIQKIEDTANKVAKLVGARKESSEKRRNAEAEAVEARYAAVFFVAAELVKAAEKTAGLAKSSSEEIFELARTASRAAKEVEAAFIDVDKTTNYVKRAYKQLDDVAISLEDKRKIFREISRLSEEAGIEANRAKSEADWAEVAAMEAQGLALSLQARGKPMAKLAPLPKKSLANIVKKVKAAKKAAEEGVAWVKKANSLKEEVRKETGAMEVVVEVLKIEDFFFNHKDQIYARLEECDRTAKDAPTNPDLTFIAESLPIINGMIHIGTTRDALYNAVDWVRKNWMKQPDPLITLSALIFRYVVDKGVEEHRFALSKEKREIWERIKNRVQKLL